MNIGIRISVIKKDTTSKNKVYISSPSVRFPIYYIILLFKYGMYIVFCTIIILMSSVSLYNCINMKKERSKEHTSELQSRFDLVCRLLLEKKKLPKIDT